MMRIKRYCLLFIVLPMAAFFSCSARIDGEVREGGAVELALKTSLEPRMIALIRSLRGFMGDTDNAPILDGPAISRSLAVQPGARSVSLKNTDPSSLEGTISISRVDDFLAGSRTRFVTYTEGQSGGTSSVVIAIDRDSAPELISRLSPEADDYLSALMAPAVTGETCTRQEYLQLVSSIYGRSLADEISGARIKAFIDFPRTVSSVQGGNASGKRAEFDVPLLDILVLEQPLRYEINW